MSPTPPSTTNSSSGQSPDVSFRVVRKRNRVPVSCAPCRHRKLKCNRAHPCDNCTKRGDSASCTYAAPGSRRKNQPSGANNSPDEMQNRIDRLEGLVLSLMNNGSQPGGPSASSTATSAAASGSTPEGSHQDQRRGSEDSDVIKEETQGEDEDEVDEVAKSIGVMKVDNNKSFFISEAHWMAILGGLSEVKTYFNDHKKQMEEQWQKCIANRSDDVPGMAYLFPNIEGEEQEVRTSFPPKNICDKLVTIYFNGFDPSMHIIHGPTFQKQYDRHWAAPQETSVVWLGQVFAMMCLALQAMQRTSDEPIEVRGQSAGLADDYRRQTAKALRCMDFTQATTTMIDTLLLYIKTEQGRSKDIESGIIMVTTITIRLAQKMGYHRDPGPYGNISPFQGEMRRRVWTALRQADIISAGQAGFMPIVRPRDTDTALPRNLFDDELYEDMKVLPPPRPVIEATPVSFIITKGSLISLLGEIVEETQSLGAACYETIMQLDHRLRQLHAATPPHLQYKPMQESSSDPPDLIQQRAVLECLYLKCLCTLHRRFIAVARQNPRFSYSRRTCIDAALELLHMQATFLREMRPGGRLASVGWYPSALTAQDYLVAAMMTALDLHYVVEAERAGRAMASDVYTWSQERRYSMMSAVEHAVALWGSYRDVSMEAFKAHASLSIMLDKLRAYQSSPAGGTPSSSGFRTSSKSLSPSKSPGPGPAFGNFGGAGDPAAMDATKVAPEHSAAMTLGMMSTGGLTSSANVFDPKNQFASSSGAGSMLNNPSTNLDPSSGLTPQYAVGDDVMQGGGSSPFPFLGGGDLGLQAMDMPSANIDWEAWDSYATGLDSANQFWPMNMDLPTDPQLGGLQPGLASAQTSQQQQQQQQQQQSPPGIGGATAGRGDQGQQQGGPSQGQNPW